MDVDRADGSDHGVLIEREAELLYFRDWFARQDAPTSVCVISGIGGIGKTVFLSQIAKLAESGSSCIVRIDGHAGLANPQAFIDYVCAEAGIRDVCQLEQQIPALQAWLSSHRAVILFDHFEAVASLETFIRTHLITLLPSQGVLVVVASRPGISLHWRTEPALVTRIRSLTLENFSWQQSLAYISRAGICDPTSQLELARATSGYPLALALRVQSYLQGADLNVGTDSYVYDISAALIRDAAANLHEFVEIVAFLGSCTQDMLAEVVGDKVANEQFLALGKLSFIRVTEFGLRVHDVVRAYVLHDLKSRNPTRFSSLLEHTVRTLSAKLERATGRVAYEAFHNLITLCPVAIPAFLYPDETIPMNISYRPLPLCEGVRDGDGPLLHALMDRGIVTGMMSRAGLDYHDGLALLLARFPESLRVIRGDAGAPAAFATILPLDKKALAGLPDCVVALLQEHLGEEFTRYERISGSSDTVLSLLSCVPHSADQYTFLDLLLALKLSGWSELAAGKRCLFLSSVAQVNAFYEQLGYEYLGTSPQSQDCMDLYCLDLRQITIGKWLVELLLQTPRQEKIRTPVALETASTLAERASQRLAQGLTSREMCVVQLVAKGYTNREIAAHLQISPRTVDAHLRHIFDKVGVSTRAGLTHWYLTSVPL